MLEMIELDCPGCGRKFEKYASDHRVIHGKTIFCSRECYLEYYRKKNTAICPVCGKTYKRKRSSNKVCSSECARKYNSMNAKHKVYMENGYLVEHKKGYNKKGNVKQHRRIMEEYLGRPLNPDEIVHHINGIKTDNRIENLQVMTWSEHSSMHRKEEIANGKHLFGGYHNN